MKEKETINEEKSMSKADLDKEVKAIRQELSAEGMGSGQKYDMAEAILDDPDFAAAIKKHYKVKYPAEWLADRI